MNLRDLRTLQIEAITRFKLRVETLKQPFFAGEPGFPWANAPWPKPFFEVEPQEGDLSEMACPSGFGADVLAFFWACDPKTRSA